MYFARGCVRHYLNNCLSVMIPSTKEHKEDTCKESSVPLGMKKAILWWEYSLFTVSIYLLVLVRSAHM